MEMHDPMVSLSVLFFEEDVEGNLTRRFHSSSVRSQVVWYAICLAGNPTAPGFEVRRRMFEVERTGEWTRGMCVVDRRFVFSSRSRSSFLRLPLDSVNPPPPSFSLRGTTEVPLEIRSKSGIHGIHAEDHVTTTPSSDEGVEVIVKTPGTKAFEKMFLERVYGVSV